jgi:sulfate transport system permease protein
VADRSELDDAEVDAHAVPTRHALGPDIQLGGLRHDQEPEQGHPGVPAGPATKGRWALRAVALVYLAALLIVPVAMVFWRTFEHGISPVIDALTSDDAVHALEITLLTAGLAVVCNTIFGLLTSFLLVRHDFPGKSILDKLIDLPIAVSPVIVGLALLLVYGPNSAIGSWFSDQGIDIIYAIPGMVIATCFVSLPLVVREVAPILEEIGSEQEEAAATLGASPFQTFRRVTLPAIRWGLAYGVVLTLARSLGEFGAVAVVSGRVVGSTQTLTLYVEDQFEALNQQAAYAAAFLLALVAIVALVVMNLLRPKDEA